MKNLIYILQTAGIAFVLAVLLAPVIIRKLRELKFGQKILEDGPTWHKSKQNTPTMGGDIDASCGQLRRNYTKQCNTEE